MENSPELEILSDGSIRFCRGTNVSDKILIDFLVNCGLCKAEEIEEFFAMGNSIEQLFGSEKFCG